MQGYVLAYRPATGDGTIITESGEAIRFAGAESHNELCGGDIVTFNIVPSKPSPCRTDVYDIEVVQKWPERLTSSYRPLLRELHSIVQMDELVH